MSRPDQRAGGVGLRNAAAPGREFDAVAGRHVASLRKGGPGARAGCKRLVRDVPKLSMAAAFAEMTERFRRFFAFEEARGGMAAFAGKRPLRSVTGD